MVGCHHQAAGTARDDTGIQSGVSALVSHHPSEVALAELFVHLQEQKMFIEQWAGFPAKLRIGQVNAAMRDLERDGRVSKSAGRWRIAGRRW